MHPPVKGEVTEVEAAALRRHLVSEMARMACDDGLVMTLHPGVRRNHHMATFEKYGADVGTDIPVQMEFTDALRPMLNRYGTHPNFQLVIFTLDETVFSRELARLLASTRPFCRRSLVVHRRARGDPPLPRCNHRVGRLRQDLRLHRRHPRLLLHSGSPRHVAPT